MPIHITINPTSTGWAFKLALAVATMLVIPFGSPADPNAVVNRYGQTQLHVAAADSDAVAVHRLLTAGAYPDARDNGGWTPLHQAAYHGNAVVAQLLLAAGADPNAEDELGNTPLHTAALEGQTAAALVLLSVGAYVDARNIDGITPLHKSVYYGFDARLSPDLAAILYPDHVARTRAVVGALLNAGADPNAEGDYGQTPLHEAVRWDNAEAIRLLLARGANPDAETHSGHTPMNYYGDDGVTAAIANLLIDAGATPPTASASQ